jgi:hypothetical protein
VAGAHAGVLALASGESLHKNGWQEPQFPQKHITSIYILYISPLVIDQGDAKFHVHGKIIARNGQL